MIKLKDLLLLLKENDVAQIKPKYSAVAIDGQSRTTLLTHFQNMIPDGWEVIAHHMTINPFGTVPDEEVNKPVQLSVNEVGKDDKALAVKVSGYDKPTKNKFAHITIAINRQGGAKPKDSNTIANWTKIDQLIILKGTVQNI